MDYSVLALVWEWITKCCRHERWKCSKQWI